MRATTLSWALVLGTMLAAIAAAEQGSQRGTLEIHSVADLVLARDLPVWLPALGGSKSDSSLAFDLRASPPAWDSETLLELLEAALFPGSIGSRSPQSGLTASELTLAVHTTDPVLHREVADLLSGLRSAQPAVRLEFSLRPDAGLAARASVSVIARSGEPFWIWVGGFESLVDGSEVAISRASTVSDPIVSTLSHGFSVTGVAAVGADGIELRDLRVQMVLPPELRNYEVATPNLNLARTIETLWSGAVAGVSTEETLVQLPGDSGGYLGVRGEPLPAPEQLSGPPLGVPAPLFTFAREDVMLVDVASLTGEPTRSPAVVDDPAASLDSSDAWNHPQSAVAPFGSDQLLDWIRELVNPASWELEDSDARSVGGSMLLLRNDHATLLRAAELVEQLADAMPATFRLHVTLAAGNTGEPLTPIHEGDLLLRSGQRGVSSNQVLHSYVKDLDAEVGQDLAALDAVTGVLPEGTVCALTPCVAGQTGLRLDVSMRHIEQVVFNQSPGSPIELPSASQVTVWTGAWLDWGKPTTIAETSSMTRTYRLTVTAYVP